MNEIKSFEQLWDEAEKRSIQVNKNDASHYLLDDIRVIINSIISNYNNDNFSKEIKSLIMQNLIGELLFTLSTITARENINIWSALKEHIDKL
jgi:hypothetical protein